MYINWYLIRVIIPFGIKVLVLPFQELLTDTWQRFKTIRKIFLVMNWLPNFGNSIRIVPMNWVTPTKCINNDIHGTCIMITWKLKNCPLIANEETTATGVVLNIFATPVWNKAFRESIHENLSVILCWAAWTWPSVKSHPLFCCRISHLILRSDGRGIYRLLVRYYGWHSGQDFKVRNIKSGCSTANIVPRSIFKCDMVILAFDPSTSQILLIYVLFLHNLLQSSSWLRRILEKS